LLDKTRRWFKTYENDKLKITVQDLATMIYRIPSSRANHKDPDEHEYPHPTNPTASFGLIYTDAVPVVVAGGV
jgi:hypothetical protein